MSFHGSDDSNDSEGFKKFKSDWKTPSKTKIKIPSISLNEQELELSASDSDEDEASFEESSAAKHKHHTRRTDTGSSKPWTTQGQDKGTPRGEEDEEKTESNTLKFWRRKLIILIWLDFLMRYRNRFTTFVELLFPIIGFATMGCALLLSHSWAIPFSDEGAQLNTSSPFHPLYPMTSSRIYGYTCSNDKFCDDDPDTDNVYDRIHYVVYAPNNSFVTEVMTKVAETLHIAVDNPNTTMFGVKNSTELVTAIQNHWKKPNTTGEKGSAKYPYGILFSFGGMDSNTRKAVEENRNLPKTLRYTIRTFYPEIANTAESFPFVEQSRHPKTRHEVSPYISTGFAGLQLAIDNVFIEMVKTRALKTGQLFPEPPEKGRFPSILEIPFTFRSYINSIYLRMYEYPMFLDDQMKIRVWTCLVFVVILAYSCTNLTVVSELVRESKEGKMELLKLHGLTPALHWISYGINAAVMSCVISVFLAVVLYFGFERYSFLDYESFVLVWLFFILFSMTQYAENVFLSRFFINPTVAGMFAVSWSVVSFLLPMLLFKHKKLPRLPNYLICLVNPHWCLANGLYSFLQYDLLENGLHWHDFPVLQDMETYIIASIPVCFILFIYSTAIFLLVTISLDRLMEKPFAPSIGLKTWWKSCRKTWPEETQRPASPINYRDIAVFYERPHADAQCTIKIRNLCKTFESETSYEVSLDHVNLDIFEGEILGVVGPAGSGKTNLLHLIAGLLNPTSGFVEMKNLKVHEHSDFLNQFISICPQKCMLFPNLSVEDHVRLCCMVHGNSYKKSKTQAKMLLRLFDLAGVRRHSYLWLNSTQQKQLAVAMALASSPTILILDEPTVGMAINAAKELWRYLFALKEKRTILVATTDMDDAELHCDKIVLMVKGKVVCYGTANRIKRKYDVGSMLNVLEGGKPTDPQMLQEIVESNTKGVVSLPPVGYNEGHRIHRFLLPFSEPYASMLEKIENRAEEMNISKIFMSRVEVGALLYKIASSKGFESTIAGREDLSGYVLDAGQSGPRTHQNLPDFSLTERTSWRSFGALFTKKWISMSQRHSFIFSEFAVPLLLMVLMTITAQHFMDFQPESLSVPIHMGMYPDSITPIKPADASSNRWIWFNSFKAALNASVEEAESNVTVPEILDARQPHTLTNKRRQAIIAVERNGDVTTGYYSANSYHAAPMVLNLMANSMLYILSRDRDDRYRIVVNNHPVLQYEGFPAGSTISNMVTVYAFIYSLIFGLITAAMLKLPIWERTSGMKNLEMMAGVRPFVYWSSNAAGDLILHLSVVLILLALVYLTSFYHGQFGENTDKLMFVMVISIYLCWSSIPFGYWLSQILPSSRNGFNHYLVIHFTLGILPASLTFQVLRTYFTTEYLIIRYIMEIFPPYSITSALIHYFHILQRRNFCSNLPEAPCETYKGAKSTPSESKYYESMFYDPVQRGCCRPFCEDEGTCHEIDDYLLIGTAATVPNLATDIFAMVAQGVFYGIVTILTEKKTLQRFIFFFYTQVFGDKEVQSTVEDQRNTEEQEDVRREHQLVDFMIDIEDHSDTEIFLCQDLVKFYGTTKCIDHIYFSVPIQFTTGILGGAKSGMSTLLNLITGQLRISSGNIYMENERMVSKTKRSCTMKMGYCPQNNAYYEDLTGFQLLKLFAQLRGVQDSEVDVQVSRWLTILGLDKDARQSCKTYRPGVLRRLCCATAMIGWPDVVILDQPTVGMDKKEAYVFWKAVHEAKKNGQTTLFTSVSGEEVRLFSDKALIIEYGALLAIGRQEEVFKETPRGFLLSIRLRPRPTSMSVYAANLKIDELKSHILRHFSHCELEFDEETVIVYVLKDLNTKLSYAYGIMEVARQRYPSLLDNFLVSEYSLDQVIAGLHKKLKLRRSTANYDDDESHHKGRKSY